MWAVGLAILLGAGLSGVYAQAGPTLSLEPETPVVEVGETFIVSVRVGDAGETTAWQVGLAYDPTVISPTGTHSFGSFLGLNDPQTLQQVDGDRAVFGVYQLCHMGDCESRSGSGELVEIEFEALRIGSTSLSFVESVLVAPDSGEQAITTQDGTVQVSSGLPMDNFIYLPALRCTD
jgi:hypothetical protein